MIAKLQQRTRHKYVLLFSVVVFVLGVGALITQAATPEEFTLTISASESPTWNTLQGVGTRIQYPATWHGRAYQAQGGMRNSATYEFTWTDTHSQTIRIEMLEIVNTDTGELAQTTALTYWQQYGTQKGYALEKVLVQGQPAWWLHNAALSAAPATLWLATGERVYRFRVHDNTATDEGTRRLRQMLTTLETIPVDWQYAPQFPTVMEPSNLHHTTLITTGVPYQRNAAFNYAQTYYDQTTNADNCYLWYDGSTLDCVYQTGDDGVDGGHFVNQTVNAGGRPIPGLWDSAAMQVAALRDWLQNDGWYTVTATQAHIGDVALIGPWDAPCWTGVVVMTGTNPTLATHSGEYWLVASELYCFSGGVKTYTKTYLHTDVTFANHLPLVLRSESTPTPTPTPTETPQPIKQRTGIHLGSRQDEWPDITLHRLNGGPRSGGLGVWPRAVVVLSGHTFVLDRRPVEQDALCSIAQARWKHESAEYDLVDYLTEANANGVTVIIRIEPSPGNFQDWAEPAFPHILLSGTEPAGPSYCWRDDWPDSNRQWGFQYFRSIADLATEIHEIYKLLEREGWTMEHVYFEPANEPNKEWFVDWSDDLEAQEKLQASAAWTEMDLYFSNLYDHLKSLDSNIQILTPPMAQGSFAETLRFTSCAPMTVSVSGESGYAFMPDTFTTKNDGYSWHNYWRKDHETWTEAGDTPCPTSEHIFQYFSSSMQTTISNSEKPAFITEADLFSPCQESDNAVTDKDLQAEETQQSLWQFMSQEQGADYVIAWLLTEYPHSTVGDCHKDPPLLNYPEIKWHEGYNNNVERIWFGPWWSGAE